MYNLAIVNGQGKTISNTFKLHAFHFSDKDYLLSTLDHIHGGIIHLKEETDLGTVFEMIVSLKRDRALPIWIKDETGSIINRKLSIELGAVGIVDSTFTEEELFVQIKNTLELIYLSVDRDLKKQNKQETFSINPQNHSLHIPRKGEINLTYLEYKIVALLATKSNQAFTYDAIYTNVWSIEKEIDTSTKKYRIANMVFHIRSKLKQQGINPDILRTVRSVGYLLDSTIEISAG